MFSLPQEKRQHTYNMIINKGVKMWTTKNRNCIKCFICKINNLRRILFGEKTTISKSSVALRAFCWRDERVGYPSCYIKSTLSSLGLVHSWPSVLPNGTSRSKIFPRRRQRNLHSFPKTSYFGRVKLQNILKMSSLKHLAKGEWKCVGNSSTQRERERGERERDTQQARVNASAKHKTSFCI